MNIRKLRKEECVGDINYNPVVIDGQDKHVESDFFIKNRDEINGMVKDRGCVILKGFGIDSVEKYEKIFQDLGINLATEYRPGIAPRVSKSASGKSFSSTEASRYMSITPHNEMAYTNYRPSIVAFWCQLAPTKYGETPLFDCSKIDSKWFSPTIKMKRTFTKDKTAFDSNGNTDAGGSTWTGSFGTDDKHLVNKYCDDIGMNYEWFPGDKLVTTIETKQIIDGYLQLQTPLYGKDVYYYMRDRFPDRFDNEEYNKIVESESFAPPIECDVNLNREQVYEFMDSVFAASVMPKWSTGDVWIIDNIKCGHARMNVVGERSIVASLANFIDIRD